MTMSFKQFFATFGEDKAKKGIDNLLDTFDFIMFFKKGKEVFGAGEDGRLVYAKMKHPDEETPSGWEDDATFSAMNLNKGLQSDPVQQIFTNKDLKKIKIINREEAQKILEKAAKELGDQAFPSKKQVRVFDLGKLFQKDPDEAPNFIQAKEKS